jgi:hypothetical protein
MKNSKIALSLSLALVLSAFLTNVTWAQQGDGYELSWWTLDGGGGTASGGGFSLNGTAGQSEAGAILSGGDYTLVSGFWSSAGVNAGVAEYKIYLPLVLR